MCDRDLHVWSTALNYSGRHKSSTWTAGMVMNIFGVDGSCWRHASCCGSLMCRKPKSAWYESILWFFAAFLLNSLSRKSIFKTCYPNPVVWMRAVVPAWLINQSECFQTLLQCMQRDSCKWRGSRNGHAVSLTGYSGRKEPVAKFMQIEVGADPMDTVDNVSSTSVLAQIRQVHKLPGQG